MKRDRRPYKGRMFSKAGQGETDPVSRMYRRFQRNNVAADRETCRKLAALMAGRVVLP